MEEIMQNPDDKAENNIVSDDEMKNIAKLAMLNLPESELHSLKGDFAKTLDLFKQLNEIDVHTVQVSYEKNKLSMAPRPDIVKHDTENNIAKIAEASPFLNKKDGYFDVPPVIE